MLAQHDQRQRHRRARHALDNAAQQQDGHVRRQRRHQAADAGNRHHANQDLAAADEITPPRQEEREQRCGGEKRRLRHTDLGGRRPQLGFHRGQRGREHGGVELEGEDRRQQRDHEREHLFEGKRPGFGSSVHAYSFYWM